MPCKSKRRVNASQIGNHAMNRRRVPCIGTGSYVTCCGRYIFLIFLTRSSGPDCTAILFFLPCCRCPLFRRLPRLQIVRRSLPVPSRARATRQRTAPQAQIIQWRHHRPPTTRARWARAYPSRAADSQHTVLCLLFTADASRVTWCCQVQTKLATSCLTSRLRGLSQSRLQMSAWPSDAAGCA